MSPNQLSRSILIALLPAILLGLLPATSKASDRDTPAYRIYVDPATGRYSTKPPADQATSSGQSSTNAAAPIVVTVGALPPGGPDIRRPLKAVLLLIAVASVSLLARAWKSSRPA